VQPGHKLEPVHAQIRVIATPRALVLVLSVTTSGLFLGGPIVQWTHGNGLKGVYSLALYLGAPLVMGALGFGVSCACASRCQPDGSVAAGVFVGWLAALCIDVGILAYDEAPIVTPHAQRLLPDVRVAGDRLEVGVVGTF
jgi:hypothetical protein